MLRGKTSLSIKDRLWDWLIRRTNTIMIPICKTLAPPVTQAISTLRFTRTHRHKLVILHSRVRMEPDTTWEIRNRRWTQNIKLLIAHIKTRNWGINKRFTHRKNNCLILTHQHLPNSRRETLIIRCLITTSSSTFKLIIYKCRSRPLQGEKTDQMKYSRKPRMEYTIGKMLAIMLISYRKLSKTVPSTPKAVTWRRSLIRGNRIKGT